MALSYSIRESAPTILRLPRDASMKENDPPADRPFRAFADWSDPHWQRAHGAAQLALRPPVRRDIRSSFRRHGPRAVEARVRRGDRTGSTLAGDRARSRAPAVGADYGLQ